MKILNALPSETLEYPLAFLYGSAALDSGTVKVDGISWPVRNGHFKVLAKLKPGLNDLAFDFGSAKESFAVRYQPKSNPKYVRLVYFLGSDQDGSFPAPAGMPNGVAEAVARIKLGGLLMQTFYAESGKRTTEAVNGSRGLQKRTFRLELDADGEPVVHVVKSVRRTAAEWRAQPSNTAYGEVHDEIRKILGNEGTFKQAVIMGFSNRDHYVAQKAAGTGVAWGGGSRDGSGNGATTGCTLYAWAPSLAEFVPAFSNRRVPEASLCRDWDYATYMGNYSTTLGGWFHEIGHTFGLGHTDYGIMSPQIDKVNRFFMIEDAIRKNEYLLPEKELPNTWWYTSQTSMWQGDFFATQPAALAYGGAEPRQGAFPAESGAGFHGWRWERGGYSLDGRTVDRGAARNPR
ncbi:MAG TPA: hypothetical protein VJ385_11090 [Fibrobacteria bacterium]|nr:hypothetical protein [Fibrobacteria bacterium]